MLLLPLLLLLLQDDGSEHPHRVCLSVRADVTPFVMEKIQHRVQEAGLQVRGWRWWQHGMSEKGQWSSHRCIGVCLREPPALARCTRRCSHSLSNPHCLAPTSAPPLPILFCPHPHAGQGDCERGGGLEVR